MEHKEVKDGMVVRLISGGPDMTVYGQSYPYGAAFEIPCVWIDSLGAPHVHNFPASALEIKR